MGDWAQGAGGMGAEARRRKGAPGDVGGLEGRGGGRERYGTGNPDGQCLRGMTWDWLCPRHMFVDGGKGRVLIFFNYPVKTQQNRTPPSHDCRKSGMHGMGVEWNIREMSRVKKYWCGQLCLLLDETELA